jgi:iron complex outermembrane receptor protein
MKLSTHRFGAAALCLASIGSSPVAALAQTTADATTEPPQQLEPVNVTGSPDDYRPPSSTTATRTQTPSLQIPQSVQVVPQAVLRDQNALSLSDALRNVAGVQFDFGFNGSLQPLTILRGFPSVSMTANGSMSGSSTYYLDGSKVTGIPINMADVQSVEVVKGPSSVLYGRAEPGGLVNVVTKAPSAVPQFSFEQTAGEYGLSRTSVEASGPLSDDRTLRGRMAVSYYTTDSIRDFVKDRLGAVTGSLAWVPDARTNVTFTADFSDERYRTDYGVPAIGDRPADLPWSRQFNDSPDLSSARTKSVKLDVTHDLSDVWQVKAKALSVRSDTSEVDIAPYREDYGFGTTPDQTCPGTGNPLCRYYFYVRPDGRYQLDQFNADLIGKLVSGSVGHTVLLGVDTYASKKTGTTYFQQISSVDIYHPVLGNTPALDTALALPLVTDDRNRWTSFYVQDQLDLGSGIFVTAALRHDRTSAIYAAPGTEPNKASFTTPRLGAVWQFTATQAVYAQYQDAVSANNGRDTVTLAPLKAERARQFEIGHKLEWLDGALASTVAVYQLTKRDRGGSVLIDQPPFYDTITIGKARSRGLEWDVSGQLTSRLSLIGSYAYTNTLVTDDPTYEGKQLANVAHHTASLWARYALDDRWTTGAGIFAQGQRQGDIGNTFELPGYARVDAMVAYRFAFGRSKAAIQFNLDNVFDKKYYASSHQFVSDWIKLGTPRTAKLTLRADY